MSSTFFGLFIGVRERRSSAKGSGRGDVMNVYPLSFVVS